MTFLELQDLVLSWLDDLEAGYFTRPQIKRWINNGLRELQKQLIQANESYYLRCQMTACVINQPAYALPADFYKVRLLEYCPSGTGTNVNDPWYMIVPCTMVESMSIPIGPAAPSVYYLKKDCLVLKSVPDNTYPLRLTYDYEVSEMTSDNEMPDAPVDYHEYIAVLATIDGLLKDGRESAQFNEKKKTYTELMKQNATQRQIDQPRHIVSTEFDGDGTYI